MKYDITPFGMTIIKKKNVSITVIEDVEKLEPVCTVGVVCKMVQPLQKQYGGYPNKLKLRTAI